ncbi:M13 family metallopeptidase [Longimicrobium sp.]|uniref:M13 family metallopeptidase n=1 Tax=Longimicrobium sp. TaxID=2029185 RepID=UPI002E30BAD1|nr:M13 family metallopeptidase [Longimicrobium sp.]HEX6037959.1 M13 family metallopeptidase [Longimicrobium sp.]
MATINRVSLAAAGLLALGACAPSGQSESASAPSPAMALGIDTTAFDRSVRPQDDFFAFVNGGWMQRTQIPADRTSIGSFLDLRDESQAALRSIIDSVSAAQNAPGSNGQKVGDMYRSFMDTARIEQLGITPLRADMQRIAAVTGREQYPELFAAMRRIGVSTPFSFGVGQDQGNSSRYVVSVSQSGLGLPDRDLYLVDNERNNTVRQGYVTYLENLLRLSGTPDAAGAARRVMAFETEIARIQWDRVRNRDRNATYNPASIADLQARTPGFRWATYLSNAGLNGVDSVIVRQPEYLNAVDALLAATPVETVKTYLTSRLLDGAAAYLGRDFRDARFAFRSRILSGQEQERPRWQLGVGAVEGALGEAVGELYVARTFSPESKARMQQLVANLLVAYRQAIDELEWMSPATKAEAQAKLASFTVKIGYPDEWKDYSGLEIRADDLLGNMRRSTAWEYADMIGRLGKPVDRTEWGMTPQTVNAYYNPVNNEIVFPAAILQPPFFDLSADDAVNYGAIGSVIGHEISHGFDDQGRKSDGQGNLRDWWTAQDATAFEQRATMLANQYSAFEPIPGARVNGRLTLGENIGDVSGVAIAYRAYHNSLQGRQAPRIGGFTGDQRFFLGYAQVWRSMAREQALRQQLLTDSHSPGMYRTNGVLANLPAFYEAFNVRPGDRMYLAPEQRVKIW